MRAWLQIFLSMMFIASAYVAHQRSVIASHTAPFPPRQIAYQMRVYHQSSVAYKTFSPSATGTVAAPNPYQAGVENRFTSCADSISVVTYAGGASAGAAWSPGLGSYNNAAVVGELAKQTIGNLESRPGTLIAGTGGVDQVIPIPGIGLSNGTQIVGGAGAVTLPAGCTVPVGLPAIETQVVPQ